MKRVLLWTLTILACLFSSCKPNLQQLIEKSEPATFIIYTYDEYGTPNGTGSGFFIESDGIGVTNWHVLNKSIKAVVKTTDGKQYEIDSVLCASSAKDLLVFRVKNTRNLQFSTLEIADSQPKKGAPVYNISAPLGMESSISEGIIASYRSDSHGDIVQVTAPISPGSSGSPLISEDGKVFAVTAFKRVDGENTNFGIVIDNLFREELDAKEFYKKNRKFNSEKSNLILLNMASDKGSDFVLNAIDFGNNATTVYMTFTNMHLNKSGEWSLWVEAGLKDKGFYIEDKETKQRYYMTSASIPTSKKNAKEVGLAKSLQFKVNFPVIKANLSRIDVMWGEGSRMPHFSDIMLDDYRDELPVENYNYRRDCALRYATERGDLNTAVNLLEELLDENPSDAISLNMMAIIHYLMGNNANAMMFLEESIDENPNDELAFLNRATIYEIEESYTDAINDVTAAIGISPENPDLYLRRGGYYFNLEDYRNALADVNKALDCAEEGDEYLDNCAIYALRAWINYQLRNISAARLDCQKAYRLSDDPETDKWIEELYDRL